jgi:4'-phosphopantetheinyl transferase
MLQGDGTVNIWWMQVDRPSTSRIEQWRQLLDTGERARAERFVFDQHRWSFIAAHALTRSMLAALCGLRTRDVRFGRTSEGRPYLLGGGLDFSLTHTGGFVAAAVCTRGRVGLDAEPARSGPGPGREVQVADAYFDPAEATLVRRDGREAFIRLWTLKEAVLKATGAGLAKLGSVRFSLDPICLVDEGFGGEWRFAQSRPDGTHVVALAHRGAGTGPAEVVVRAVPWDDL